MKKLLKLLVSIAMTALLFPVQAVAAEDSTPFTDSDYWNNVCSVTENSTSDDCERYRTYMRDQASDMASQLKDVQAKKAEFEADIASYTDQVNQLQIDINALQVKINDTQAKIDELQTQIDDKQKEIDAKQKSIDDTQKEIDTISIKIKNRMVAKQSSLKINKYWDILAGASSLADWLRIMSGLKAISDSDKDSSDKLVALRTKMITEKNELLQAQDEIKKQQAAQQTEKDALAADQQTYVVKQATYELAISVADAQVAAQTALEGTISSNIDQIRETLKKVSANSNLIFSGNWVVPVVGAYKSAGTWDYYGGGGHLGFDFAAPSGTVVHAAANGIIINSANGCSRGYLGNMCGYQYGGLNGAGNQVAELAIAGDGLYAISYYHLLLNTAIATGTVVDGGDQIGLVGSSGNSSGEHCHVEIVYLGDASNFDSYLNSWNGDLEFGSHWMGYDDGYGRRCDHGYSAPCRIRPESVFGEDGQGL